MSNTQLEDILVKMQRLSRDDLESIISHARFAVGMIDDMEVSTDKSSGPRLVQDDLAEEARAILENEEIAGGASLADHSLLAAVVLSDSYGEETFNSRDVNDMVVECGLPRISHITSAVSKLVERGYLNSSGKELQLSAKGRVKARGLISMLEKKRDAA